MTNPLIDAIQNKTVLEIEYFPGRRIIEPHTLGFGKDGQLLLRAFQTDGVSASGEPIHWKLFRVDRIRHLTSTNDHFVGPREGYRRGDSIMKGGITAQL
jgi:predicted DNA-binding transcriptional regulator YafY